MNNIDTVKAFRLVDLQTLIVGKHNDINFLNYCIIKNCYYFSYGYDNIILNTIDLETLDSLKILKDEKKQYFVEALSLKNLSWNKLAQKLYENNKKSMYYFCEKSNTYCQLFENKSLIKTCVNLETLENINNE